MHSKRDRSPRPIEEASTVLKVRFIAFVLRPQIKNGRSFYNLRSSHVLPFHRPFRMQCIFQSARDPSKGGNLQTGTTADLRLSLGRSCRRSIRRRSARASLGLQIPLLGPVLLQGLLEDVPPRDDPDEGPQRDVGPRGGAGPTEGRPESSCAVEARRWKKRSRGRVV